MPLWQPERLPYRGRTASYPHCRKIKHRIRKRLLQMQLLWQHRRGYYVNPVLCNRYDSPIVEFKMVRRRGTTRKHVGTDLRPRSNAGAGPFSTQRQETVAILAWAALLWILALAKARAQCRYPQRSRPSEQRRPTAKSTQPWRREAEGQLAASLARYSPTNGMRLARFLPSALLPLRATHASISTVS